MIVYDHYNFPFRFEDQGFHTTRADEDNIIDEHYSVYPGRKFAYNFFYTQQYYSDMIDLYDLNGNIYDLR